MAEVIELNPRLAGEKRRLEAQARRRAASVAGALSCGLCPRRCSHCGQPLETYVSPPPEAAYPMCEACLEEYQAFVRREAGFEVQEVYWHTEEWAETWRSWLAHMRANDVFRRSRAFLRLMEEYSE